MILSGAVARGQNVTPLYKFGALPGVADGASPWSGVVQDALGNTFGTTYVGGTSPNCGAGGCGTLWKLSPTGVLTTLHTFQGLPNDGALPVGGLAINAGGDLYGTTLEGGGDPNCANPVGCGAIFRYAAGIYQQVYAFKGNPNAKGDGASPYSTMLFVGNLLYGTTFTGGVNNNAAAPDGFGTLFSWDPVLNKEKVLHSFALADGVRPEGSLMFHTDGKIYGTSTVGGGAGNDGSIWSYNPGNGVLAPLHLFNHVALEGSVPVAGLTSDGLGNLFGVTAGGGNNVGVGCTFNQVNGCGTIYKFTPATSGFNTVHSFVGTDGMFPISAMVRDCHGTFFGSTYLGGALFFPPRGANTDGSLFSFAPTTGTFTKLVDFSFNGAQPGDAPYGDLIKNTEGSVVGTTLYGGNAPVGFVAGCGLAFRLGDVFANAANLNGFGIDSLSNLVPDANGNLIGTTKIGGAFGDGMVFRLVNPGLAGGAFLLNDLHDFTGGADGANPTTGVVIDANQNIFGTTSIGGGAHAFGTVWEIPAAGGFLVLHPMIEFGAVHDGNGPSSIAIDAAGNLFGTASQGGAGGCAAPGCGTAFTLTKNVGGYAFSVIFPFVLAKGSGPNGLLVDAAGVLWGTAAAGGTHNCGAVNCGTVFKLTPPAVPSYAFTMIHDFNDGVAHDGFSPNGTILKDPANILWGTTKSGGHGFGTLFNVVSVAPFGFTTMHNFAGGADGAIPLSGLIRNGAGALFGTTSQGGPAGGQGTVYRLGPAGVYSIAHSFSGAEAPAGSLYSDGCGYLFGTTQGAGAANAGYIYDLLP